MYQALYRKYRPMIFRDVVGQSHITTTLKNEIKNRKIAHAYLFSGTRGTGKTTCARILAKGVNCPNAKDGDPCNECAFCHGVNDGTLLDVIEIDGASNTGVDNIRDLRDEALYTPSMASYKVYIIDEVHMLSTGAFNALLKILEDPPSHVIFVLATTEAHKIAPTILSRCQRFDFRRLTQDDIVAHLSNIARKEGLSAKQEALYQIASLSDGAMRDAVSMLDQCAASGVEITLPHVLLVMGLCGENELLSLAEAIVQNNVSSALGQLSELYDQSASMSNVCSSLLELFRKLMICKAVEDPSSILQCDAELIRKIQALGRNLSLERVLYCLTRLEEVLSALPRSFSPRAMVEMCLFSLCDPRLEYDSSALLARISALESRLSSAPAATLPPVQQPIQNTPEKETPSPALTKRISSSKKDSKPHKEPEKQVQKNISPLTCWAEIQRELSSHLDQSFTSLLHGAKAYAQGEVLTVVSDHPLVQLRFGDSNARSVLLSCAAKHLSEQVHQICFLSSSEFIQKQGRHSENAADSFDELLSQNSDIISVIE